MTGDVREQLIAMVTASAEWRAQKAEEQPDEPRHAQCASALARAARELREMPDNEPRLTRIQRLVDRTDEEVADQFLVEAGDIVARHGFDRAGASTDDLLAALLEAAVALSGAAGVS